MRAAGLGVFLHTHVLIGTLVFGQGTRDSFSERGAVTIPDAKPTLAADVTTVRAISFRFVETWVEASLGLLGCVLLPIWFYASTTPFSDGFGATERNIIATGIAYAAVWYCSRRFDSFPGGSLTDQAGYIAPIAAVAYATIAVVFLALRLEYSRFQLFGSGLLTLVWLLAVARIRARHFVHTYAVVPSMSLAGMPSIPGCRWLTFEDAQDRSARVDAIVADLSSGLSKHELSAVTRAAIAGVSVLDRRFIVESLTGRTPLSGLAPNDFGVLLPSRQYLLFRRALELIATVAVLPLLAPLVLLIAVAIKLDSKGPAFFIQMRVGHRGRTFRLVKFRTMRHAVGGPSFTALGDSRITRLGALLRRYRLDELPQVWNILCGDMSWVGPRPEALELGRTYARDIPHFELRGIVRPGLTGWAQVNQGYAHTPDEMRTKLEYDLYYLKHCSLWLDLVIVLRTASVVLRGTGAR
jgi:lipopolysaccharide/colanic/teichoic acid biosynthesis glycosyltransferase